MNMRLLTCVLLIQIVYLVLECQGIAIGPVLLTHLRTSKLNYQRPTLDSVTKESSGYATASVETTSGPVVGVTTGNSHAFYQIPYAEPPVGPLRWRDPQPIQTLFQEINATVNNPAIWCYQDPASGAAHRGTESEDCLLLNVFVPLTVSFPVEPSTMIDNLLPVMFYIHGGSFKIGSGTSDSRLDGKELARVTNTVVVTINYRLGALGFLTLDEEGQDYIEGNQGLRDQRLALQWVQNNIGNFGGDKNQVTIFGNSAGAQSVMLHMVSPRSKDLFRAAIQQSNPSIFSFYHPTQDAALRISRRLIEGVRCNGTGTTERQCLLALPPQEIVNAVPTVETITAIEERSSVYSEETFYPIIDGEDVTDLPMNLFKTGQWNKDNSMIIGVNTEENLDFQFYFPEGVVVDENALQSLNRLTFGAEYAETITEKYIRDFPPPEGEDYKITYGHELSNYYFDCPSRLLARYASDTGNKDVFFYANSNPVLLDYCVTIQGGNTTGCKLAYHASEVRYVFRTLLESQEITEADRIVENEFSTYWGSFARTESPSENLGASLGNFTVWPRYQNAATSDIQSWSHVEITAPTSIVDNAYKSDICDFWDSINYARVTIATTTAATTASTTMVEQTTSAGIERAHISILSLCIVGIFQLISPLY